MTRRERRRPVHDERRAHRRVAAAQLGSITAHLSGGSPVTLLDVAQRGVRLETGRHMRPGQTVSVRFTLESGPVTICATVVRARVVRLHPEEVRYETGLRLADDLASVDLQLSLVERRELQGDPPDVDDIVAPPQEIVFTRVDDAAALAESRNGWWLAGARRRRRGVLAAR